MNPKDMVRAGYDAVSYEYRADDADEGHYAAWLDELIPLLPDWGAVLDLGCGCGVPVARRLMHQGFGVTGVDLSPVQIERAKRLVPEGRFLCADLTSLELPEAAFEAIVSFYAIIHVPIDEQPAVFRHISGWLKPGGLFMATLGSRAWTGTEPDWLGAPMYWSHADEDTYIRWLPKVSLRVLRHQFVPKGDGGHTLVLAQKVVGEAVVLAPFPFV